MNAPAKLMIHGLVMALMLPLAGCVSNGKYQDMVTQRNGVVADRDRLASEREHQAMTRRNPSTNPCPPGWSVM